MLEEIIRQNRTAVLRAAENLQWKTKLAGRIKYQRLGGAERSYDDRNIDNLAPMLIDVSDKTGAERENYFREETEKIIDAYEGKGDISPYIKRMYDEIFLTSDIDWSDERQIERMFSTLKISQALATMFKDFKEETYKLYNTREEQERLDAIIGKSYMLFFEIGEAIKKAGLAPEIEEHIQIGLKERAGLVTNTTIVKKDSCSDIYDAAIAGEYKNITVDPTRSENMTKFFLKQDFTLFEDDGFEFTQDDYAREYINSLSQAGQFTTLEQFAIRGAINGGDGDFEYRDLLFINGKSMAEISKEQSRNQYEGDKLAGKILRDALTDGKSVVTLLRASCTRDGKMKFHHQNVSVDLDKLNDIDRNTTKYNFIRRFLDKYGIWKIQKYPTNAERDAKQAKLGGISKHESTIRKTEDRIIELYNSNKPTTDNRVLVSLIPKVMRFDPEAEKQNGEPTLENEKRERIEHIDLTAGEPKTETSPKVESGAKSLDNTVAKY